jgi:CheY-like chemotaxis protein
VLVIDDDPILLSAIRRSFKAVAGDFRVETAADGVEGLFLIGSFQPTVLVLDIRMPTLDGFEVMQRLRANPETKNLPVVAMSGQMDEPTTERCKKLGAVVCLSKPVGGSRLLETLHEFRQGGGDTLVLREATWPRDRSRG